MTFEPTLIAPYKSGLSQYLKPFLIGNDAFQKLDNCYSSRGFIKKREGSIVLGRLPIWNTATAITDVSPPVVTTATNHGLLTGDMVFLELALTAGNPILAIAVGFGTTITMTGAHGMTPGDTIVIIGTTGTISTALNNKVITLGPLTAGVILDVPVETAGLVWGGGGTVSVGAFEKQAFVITVTGVNTFTLQNLNTGVNVPASGAAVSANIYLPIVGTRTFLVSAVGSEQLIVFTPKQAFLFDETTQLFVNISFTTGPTPILWTGTKDNFFYTSNYATVMWTTNNVNVIRFYTGLAAAGWFDFVPIVTGATTMTKTLIILPYKGRLVALNTTEGGTNFFSRARWSQLGTPFVANAPAPFTNDVDAWRSDIPGKGGFIDADTSERIVSAEIIQDTLIVGFQFSTWRLRFTGNEILPFVWERISTQFGSEGTFTTVPFDDKTLQISRRGIVGASFNAVSRIDLPAIDLVEDIEVGINSIGIQRVQGIRDYVKRMVYWIYGFSGTNEQTPNKLICYNYQDNTWSTFTQSFTTLGQYRQSVDNTWGTWFTTWGPDTEMWNETIDQQNTPIIVAGAKDSRVWRIMVDETSTDNGQNYNFVITTNWINPYFQNGSRCKLAYYDLYVTMTDKGQITVENFTDDNPTEAWLIKTANVSATYTGGTESFGNVVKYVRVFLGMIARNHQITLTLSDPDQLDNTDIGSSDFQLQGIIFHTREEGRVKQ